jgi:hypothetical protein
MLKGRADAWSDAPRSILRYQLLGAHVGAAEGVQLCILWMLVDRQRRQPSELVEDDVDACAHNLHACS